ncbi:MAG: NADH-quinone oxidoreductase subunit H [Sphingobacterium sp.]|nr:NADH-quinone oxidoreductase subunit H [Sphingobacterium sp.]
MNVGLLYIISVAGIGIYGIILGGWSSNSKYPLLASLRSSAQLISYEIAVTMTLVTVIMLSGTLSMVGIVDAQLAKGWWFALHAAGGVLHLLRRRRWPRRTARRSTCPRPSRSWWPASTPSTRACGSRSSSWPNTRT